MYCENCGKKNEDGAQFCSNCGAKLEKKDIFDFDKSLFDIDESDYEYDDKKGNKPLDDIKKEEKTFVEAEKENNENKANYKNEYSYINDVEVDLSKLESLPIKKRFSIDLVTPTTNNRSSVAAIVVVFLFMFFVFGIIFTAMWHTGDGFIFFPLIFFGFILMVIIYSIVEFSRCNTLAKEALAANKHTNAKVIRIFQRTGRNNRYGQVYNIISFEYLLNGVRCRTNQVIDAEDLALFHSNDIIDIKISDRIGVIDITEYRK